ncbi:MAG: hypothetical protein QXN16_00685 [Candidatus Micrarchaeaceae archaeon]
MKIINGFEKTIEKYANNSSHVEFYNPQNGAMIRYITPSKFNGKKYFVDANMLLEGKRVDGFYKNRKDVLQLVSAFLKEYSLNSKGKRRKLHA